MLNHTYANTTVSEGTLKEVDLIEVFTNFLASVDKPFDTSDRLSESRDDDYNYYLLEDLFDALNDIAPKGCYFGSHPRDGACFGFWDIGDE